MGFIGDALLYLEAIIRVRVQSVKCATAATGGVEIVRVDYLMQSAKRELQLPCYLLKEVRRRRVHLSQFRLFLAILGF